MMSINQKENGELASIHSERGARRIMAGKRIGVDTVSDDSLDWFGLTLAFAKSINKSCYCLSLELGIHLNHLFHGIIIINKFCSTIRLRNIIKIVAECIWFVSLLLSFHSVFFYFFLSFPPQNSFGFIFFKLRSSETHSLKKMHEI